MDLTREQLEAMLADYVDGNLSGDELAQAEAFLQSNPGVRDVLTRLMVDSEAIRTLPRVAPPVADLTEDLRGSLERDMLLGNGPVPTEPPRRVSSSALAIAAMLLIGLGAGFVAFQILAKRPEPPVISQNTPADNAARREAVPTSQRASAGRAVQRRASDLPTETAAVVPTVPQTQPLDTIAMADRGGRGSAPDEAAAGTLADQSNGIAIGGAAAPMPAPMASRAIAAMSPQTVQLAGAPVPDEVASLVARQVAAERADANVGRRAVAFVIQLDDANPAAATRVAEQAAAYFAGAQASRAAVAGATFNGQTGQVERLFASSDTGAGGGMAIANASAGQQQRFTVTSNEAMSNTATTSPVGEAMAAAVNGPTSQPSQTTALDGIVAHDVPEAVAAGWQAQADASLGLGKVIAYELPAAPSLQEQQAKAQDFFRGPTTQPTSTEPPVQQQQQQQISGVGGEMSRVGSAIEQAMSQGPTTQPQTLDVYIIVQPANPSASTRPTTQP